MQTLIQILVHPEIDLPIKVMAVVMFLLAILSVVLWVLLLKANKQINQLKSVMPKQVSSELVITKQPCNKQYDHKRVFIK